MGSIHGQHTWAVYTAYMGCIYGTYGRHIPGYGKHRKDTLTHYADLGTRIRVTHRTKDEGDAWLGIESGSGEGKGKGKHTRV